MATCAPPPLESSIGVLDHHQASSKLATSPFYVLKVGNLALCCNGLLDDPAGLFPTRRGRLNHAMVWHAVGPTDGSDPDLVQLQTPVAPGARLTANPICGQRPCMSMDSAGDPLATARAYYAAIPFPVEGTDRLRLALKRADGQDGYLMLDEHGLHEVSAARLTEQCLFDIVDVSDAVKTGGDPMVNLEDPTFFVPTSSAEEEAAAAAQALAQPQGTPCGTSTLVKLAPGSDEYVAVEAYFQGTLGRHAHIDSIEKVHNEHQAAFFEFWYDKMTRRSPTKTPPQSMDLWHGTRRTPTSVILGDENGFDMRHGMRGMWGQGIYFAERAEYSDRYAHKPGMHPWDGGGGGGGGGGGFGFQGPHAAYAPQGFGAFGSQNAAPPFGGPSAGSFGFGGGASGFSFSGGGGPSGFSSFGGGGGGGASGFSFGAGPSHGSSPHEVKEIVLARVLVGQPCEMGPDSSLRMPPMKANAHGAGSQDRYDSVTGMTGGSRVYVTYDNGAAKPAYKITYRG